MSKLIDNLIAYRILRMLITPWNKTDAYKEGIIDRNGNQLKKVNELKTSSEKKAYTYLDRLVFNMKRILEKIPGGKSKIGSMTAAYWLIRECYEGRETVNDLENKFIQLHESIDNKEFLPIDEYLDIKDFIAEEEGPINRVGSQDHASVKEPVVRNRKRKRKFKEFEVNSDVLCKFKKGKCKFRKWSDYLNLDDEHQHEIYKFARRNPDAVIVLNDSENGVKRAIRYSRNGGGRWKQIQRKQRQEEIKVDSFNT